MTLELGPNSYGVQSMEKTPLGRFLLTLDREPMAPPGRNGFDCIALLRDGPNSEPVRISQRPEGCKLTVAPIY